MNGIAFGFYIKPSQNGLLGKRDCFSIWGISFRGEPLRCACLGFGNKVPQSALSGMIIPEPMRPLYLVSFGLHFVLLDKIRRIPCQFILIRKRVSFVHSTSRLNNVATKRAIDERFSRVRSAFRGLSGAKF